MNPLQNTFGIEIECYLPVGKTPAQAAAVITAAGTTCIAEGYNHLTRGHWKIVTDGSLGDYQRGIEVVSPVLTGEDGLAQIDRVMGALTAFGCTVSKKCGLHVHVGAPANPSIGFFRSLTKLYAHYEGVIDAFMAPSRRAGANLYCRTMTAMQFADIDRATSLDGLLRLLPTQGNQRRFHKLNLSAYGVHRTVEFRQHAGTVDAEKAKAWTMFCLRMVELAKREPTVGGPVVAQVNRARPGTMAHRIGEMMLRPEGVTAGEVIAMTGWRSVPMVQRAQACGFAYTTQRTGREVRYFAQAAAASVTEAATLRGLTTALECSPAEASYFLARTVRMTLPVNEAA